MFKTKLSFILAALLLGCGGGGGDEKASHHTQANTPNANYQNSDQGPLVQEEVIFINQNTPSNPQITPSTQPSYTKPTFTPQITPSKIKSEEVIFKNNNFEIFHNGFGYNTIKSPITGRVWLDRNIGANKVCQSKDDQECFGDYFQWGRKANGHEKKDSEVIDLTNNPLFVVDVEKDGKFATWADDWRSDKTNRSLWDGVNAPNNPCPGGFRLPTRAELLVETKLINKDEYPSEVLDGQYSNLSNFLKLPNSGIRFHRTRDGIFETQTYNGKVWTSELGDDAKMAYKFEYYPGGSNITLGMINTGLGVRCIKDYKKGEISYIDETTGKEEVIKLPEFKVNHTNIAQDSQNVAVNTKPVFTFSRSISPVGIDNFIITNKKTNIAHSPALVIPKGPNMIELNLQRYDNLSEGGFARDTDYEIKLTGIKDSAGELMQDFTLKFHTEKSKIKKDKNWM